MDQVLAKQFVGEAVTVKLGTNEYQLSYPMQAIILYKQKTAEIDRRRAAGRPRLKPAEIADLREQVKQLLQRSRTFQPTEGESWDPAKQEEWNRLLDEASDTRAIVTADAGQGDSLFDVLSWRLIDPVKDPERVIAALWAGIQGRAPQVTFDNVQLAVDLSNGSELTFAIARSLSAYIRKSEVPDPNAPTPAQTPAERIP